MNTSPFRATCGLILALAMLSLASASSAQQPLPTSPVQAAPVQTPSTIAPPVPGPAAFDATAAPADGGSRSLKPVATALRELSPWSMFLSADILVKAVMIGLALASVATWTIFIAKMIELSVIQRGLRAALGRISDARSLARHLSLFADVADGCTGDPNAALTKREHELAEQRAAKV